MAIFATHPSWNYTTFLDLAALLLIGVFGWRFLSTGGRAMLKAMAQPPPAHSAAVHDPVCGMTVDPAAAKETAQYGGKTFYFCSAGCRSAFTKDPAIYAQPGAPTAASSSD